MGQIITKYSFFFKKAVPVMVHVDDCPEQLGRRGRKVSSEIVFQIRADTFEDRERDERPRDGASCRWDDCSLLPI